MKTIITLSNISVTSKCPYEQALWSGTSPLKRNNEVQKISHTQEEQSKYVIQLSERVILFSWWNKYKY